MTLTHIPHIDAFRFCGDLNVTVDNRYNIEFAKDGTFICDNIEDEDNFPDYIYNIADVVESIIQDETKLHIIKTLNCQDDDFIIPNQTAFNDCNNLIKTIYLLIADNVLQKRDCAGLAFEYTPYFSFLKNIF